MQSDTSHKLHLNDVSVFFLVVCAHTLHCLSCTVFPDAASCHCDFSRCSNSSLMIANLKSVSIIGAFQHFELAITVVHGCIQEVEKYFIIPLTHHHIFCLQPPYFIVVFNTFGNTFVVPTLVHSTRFMEGIKHVHFLFVKPPCRVQQIGIFRDGFSFLKPPFLEIDSF